MVVRADLADPCARHRSRFSGSPYHKGDKARQKAGGKTTGKT